MAWIARRRDSVTGEIVDEELTVQEAINRGYISSVTDQRQVAKIEMADFIIGLGKQGLITIPEAAQWLAGNSIPTAVQNYLDNITDLDEKAEAFAQVHRRPYIGRLDPMVLAVQNAAGYTDAQVDNFFNVKDPLQ